ncbi:MAG: ABC transporter permease [Clostridia bacterium]|nr:ABC transporter permease [Clostridia bacterium]
MGRTQKSKKEITRYPIRLQAQTKGITFGLSEAWQYRDLVLLLARKSFTTTYRQTMLGPLWIVFQPLLSSLICMFIFGHVAAIGTDGIPQILFYFASSSVWELFAFSLNSNAGTFVNNAYLFSKVYFPRLTVPFSNLLVGFLKFSIQFVITMILVILYTARGIIHPLWAAFPLLPISFLVLSFFGMSVGILLSSLTTRYRDLLVIVNIAVNLWMYASAVVYPLSSLPAGTLRTIILLNPVTSQMELVRRILLGAGGFYPLYCFGGLAIMTLIFLAGTALFNRVERTFADTV